MKQPRWSEQDLARIRGKVRSGVVGTRTQRSGGLPTFNASVEASRDGERQATTRRTNAAGSNPASSPYRSKWEANYAKVLDFELKAGAIANWWYEPLSLRLPGGARYKPDFMVIAGDGITLIEVKGWSKNRRDGITRLKVAAGTYRCFIFRLVWMESGGFNGIYITA